MTPEGGRFAALSAVRIALVCIIGVGYGSTMALGPHAAEWGRHLGSDPSWFGINALFFLSGLLAWRSLSAGRTGLIYLRSRVRRTLPVLTLYTLAVASILYPLLCNPGRLDPDGVLSLLVYTLRTVSLASPGGVMPGALDAQPYQCLLQGTVWTLRWGALLHLGTLAVHAIGLRGPRAVLALSGAALMANVVGLGLYMWAGAGALEPLAPAFRFAYPWMLGAAAWQFRNQLPQGSIGWAAIGAVLLALAALHHGLLPWSPAIEILATLGWCAVTLSALSLRLPVLADWRPLALPFYLGIWPALQVMLYVAPDMATPVRTALALSVALALAYAVSRALSGVFSPPAASQLNSPRTA